MIDVKLLNIHYDDEGLLHQKCQEVPLPLDEDKKQLIKDMVQYLKDSQDEENQKEYSIRSGVGLAAPQIGINERFFAVYFHDNDKEYSYGLVNPKIVSTSSKKIYLDSGEGCLSVKKDIEGHVIRYKRITIKGYDVLSEKEVLLRLTDYPAIVFQHEYDHLDGILYYDRINSENLLGFDENAEAI